MMKKSFDVPGKTYTDNSVEELFELFPIWNKKGLFNEIVYFNHEVVHFSDEK